MNKTFAKPTPKNIRILSQRLGCALTPEQSEKLASYLTQLERWNKKVNLTGVSGWENQLKELVIDSWHLALFLKELPLPQNPKTLDLGAGGGVPGIPLRIFWHTGSYTMVEIREKRVAFLRALLPQLSLKNTDVLKQKAEQLLPPLLPADMIVSRAFKPWADLLPLAKTLLTKSGFCIIMANEPPPQNIAYWQCVAQKSYKTAGKKRYFWGLCPESISI